MSLLSVSNKKMILIWTWLLPDVLNNHLNHNRDQVQRLQVRHHRTVTSRNRFKVHDEHSGLTREQAGHDGAVPIGPWEAHLRDKFLQGLKPAIRSHCWPLCKLWHWQAARGWKPYHSCRKDAERRRQQKTTKRDSYQPPNGISAFLLQLWSTCRQLPLCLNFSWHLSFK